MGAIGVSTRPVAEPGEPGEGLDSADDRVLPWGAAVFGWYLSVGG